MTRDDRTAGGERVTERERAVAHAPLADVGGDVRVSVSITAYNHAPYIAQAVEAALAQRTSFPFEVIVGDDCSTDTTRDVLRALQRRHPDRLRLVLPEHNLGGGGKVLFARTLELARGHYVASMDGDDYWTAPDKLQRQVDYLDAHPECSMCFHDVLEVREDGTAPPRRQNRGAPPARIGMRQVLRYDVVIPACSPLFRREVVCPLPPWYFTVRFGDTPLYMLAAERGDIGFIDAVMGVYRIHPGGVWAGMPSDSRRFESLIGFYEELDAATGRRHSATIQPLLTRAWSILADAYGREGRHAAARRAAWRTLRAEPLGGEYSRRVMLRTIVQGHA